ncbi:DNA-protecting protein DprA [Candidatus Shapirobacteria bacterium CG_4_9_14_0_2_um_filter_39_11]|uniref:DNA-protecting protein DprA n=1 Tax=Candidatus Shapirobacteria bacterium CG_4_9_14_0_2_um_filter_39_11 TaxID=1974478 RepID=A0A2M8ES39_9BACT|nr:MAG: DNA-protecting protein DprA [Candidatus Shapirobacteria bacterium CG_4_9_14_0_2_um_filter_39_11]
MDDERLYWLGFSAFNGIGPKRFALLKNYFGSAKKAWEAKEKELVGIGLDLKIVTNFLKFRSSFDLSSYYLRLCEKKIECYFLDGENYPENLKKIDNPPFVLYVKGVIRPQDELSVAVVGTRKMSGYGGQVTESLVADLVANGLTIVSGLARGIDSTAHKSTLSAGGQTIGVLACGLDRVYPPENEKLVEEICAGHGAVVSEFPLGMEAVPGNFPARNRIISGLSLGTIVIEGAEDSGALITARHAADQGREVFAVPGQITSRNSAGPASLIKMGAKLVWDVNDILEELNISTKRKAQRAKQVLPESPEEESLLSLLKDEGKHLDQLVRESGFDTAKVASIMTMMEIKGKVRNLGNMVYAINK